MNKPEPPFYLTEGEKLSPVWQKLVTYFEDRLLKLQIANSGDLNEIDTAKTRGKIAEVKMLLALNRDRQELPR